MLILKGRSILKKEYPRRALLDLSNELRKRGFEKLYVIDFDGIERNKPQLNIVQILSEDFFVLYEAGPRFGVNIIDLIIAGADIAYMNTLSLNSLEEIETALSLTDGVGLKIDWADNLLGFGEGIEGSSVRDVLDRSRSMGTEDFALPSEIVLDAARWLVDEKVKLRAINQSDQDLRIRDKRITSSIVNYKFILEGGT